MKKIAAFIVKYRFWLLAAFAAFFVYCGICVNKVNVEYSVASYLPQNTDTAKAMVIMENEFTTFGTSTVMIRNSDFQSASQIRDRISGIDGVKSVPLENNEKYIKDGMVKLTVTYDGSADSPVAIAAYNKVLQVLQGSDYLVPMPLSSDYADVLSHEMMIIVAIAAAVILAVLFFTSKSFAEVAVFPIVFVVAAVLNMGTNHWLGSISFVSNTVCIILQLALAIDYAIILCHRFTEEKDLTPNDPKGAMTAALTKAIPEISSSSLTTISGLVALMFMQLGLGFDLGMVLAKSIVCSLITVFILMPTILLLFSKPIDKSRHKSFVPKFRFWGVGVIKARYVLIAVFVALFGLGAAFSQRVDYVYSMESIDTSRPTATAVAKAEYNKTFGYDTAFVILLPNDDYELQRRVLSEVGSDELIASATGLAGIELADGIYLTDSITSLQFAEITGISRGQSGLLFAAYALGRGESYTAGYRVPIIELVEYLGENVDRFVPGEMREQVMALVQTLADARAQLQGPDYSRLLFTVNAAAESPETFAMIERITPLVRGMTSKAIFAGESMSAYDLSKSFARDNMLVTVLTVVFIFVILALTFKSYGIPLVLVLVIQGAIFINFSLPFIIGRNLFFFVYLILTAIQMGATIDYAILLTNRYRSLKAEMPPRDALIEAISRCFPTVFTSGAIMSIAGFLVGGLVSDALISSIGMFLGTGTLISILCVMAFLPALLYTLDPIIEKTVYKKPIAALFSRKNRGANAHAVAAEIGSARDDCTKPQQDNLSKDENIETIGAVDTRTAFNATDGAQTDGAATEDAAAR